MRGPSRGLLLAVTLATGGCNAIAGIDPPIHDPCLDSDAGAACVGSGGAGGAAGASTVSSASSASSTSAGGGAPAPFCGDGHVDLGEECDDGNTLGGDGCTGCRVDCSGPGTFLDPQTFHCYRLVTMPALGWSQARDACHMSGAHLATFTSAAELAFAAPHVPGHAWIDGLRDGAGYRWDDGEAWTFADWKSGSPPSDDHKACVKLEGGAFDVDDCGAKMAFVCELDPAGT